MSDDLTRPTDEVADNRERQLPEHERRDDDGTVGAGVMSAGGTAVDRGTGELGGAAQHNDPFDAEETQDLHDEEPLTAVGAGGGAGGQAPFMPAVVADTDEDDLVEDQGEER